MVDKRIKMLVVGKEGQFRQTVDLAKTCGVADRVMFTGQVDYTEVPRYIAATDVCLIPFKPNAISAGAVPLKLFEYMACGKPVLSTRMQGVEGVAHDIVQYCSSVGDYARTITALHEDETFRRQMGQEGKKLISAKYDWEVLSKTLESTLARAATAGEDLPQRASHILSSVS
jgi:glycosyltransferase involved in cell wall biosynthesis